MHETAQGISLSWDYWRWMEMLSKAIKKTDMPLNSPSF